MWKDPFRCLVISGSMNIPQPLPTLQHYVYFRHIKEQEYKSIRYESIIAFLRQDNCLRGFAIVLTDFGQFMAGRRAQGSFQSLAHVSVTTISQRWFL